MHTAGLLLKGDPLSYCQNNIPQIRKSILAVLYANMQACKDWSLA